MNKKRVHTIAGQSGQVIWDVYLGYLLARFRFRAASIRSIVRTLGLCMPDSTRESVSWRIPASSAN